MVTKNIPNWANFILLTKKLQDALWTKRTATVNLNATLLDFHNRDTDCCKKVKASKKLAANLFHSYESKTQQLLLLLAQVVFIAIKDNSFLLDILREHLKASEHASKPP